MEMNIYALYKTIALQNKLSNSEIRKLWTIIEPICKHEEFLKRCQAPFFHHDLKTLGEHIISDTVVTYKLSNKLKNKNKALKVDLAVLIAMFHDLYEIPWQNSHQQKRFVNLHGFVHPIEAAINAITWYPKYFKNKTNALIIIDGIIHHMYPFPVRAFDGSNLELNNEEKWQKLPNKYQEMIKESTKIGKIGSISLRKTFFFEGRIMSKADKIVSFRKDLKNIHSYVALVDGRNKRVEEYIKSSR